MTINWWTLGLQAVNVAVLIWLLGRFFWRPVAAMVEQRRATAQQILAEATAKRQEAKTAMATIEQTRAGFAQEREAMTAAAYASAAAERTALLAKAAKEAETLVSAARANLAQETDAAHKAWADRASDLALDIAKRLASRLDGPAVRAGFLDWLLEEIRTLPDPARQAVGADGVALEAVSATPFPPEDQERTRTMIEEAFGGHPRIAFTTDPALIAGLELRGPHLLVSNSWRADLTQILADLAHDRH